MGMRQLGIEPRTFRYTVELKFELQSNALPTELLPQGLWKVALNLRYNKAVRERKSECQKNETKSATKKGLVRMCVHGPVRQPT